MATAKEELIVLRFSGTFKAEEGYVFATCNEAPIVGCGKSEQEARQDALKALDVYVSTIISRGEMSRALREGKFPHIRVLPKNLGIEMGSPIPPQRQKNDGWLVPAWLPMRSNRRSENLDLAVV